MFGVWKLLGGRSDSHLAKRRTMTEGPEPGLKRPAEKELLYTIGRDGRSEYVLVQVGVWLCWYKVF